MKHTLKVFELSGNHDEDYFLTEDDLGEHFELLDACHHQGQCDDDVNEAKKYFSIKDMVSATNYLIGCGIERDRFGIKSKGYVKKLKEIGDLDAVYMYYLWMLSGDIQERMEEETDNERKQYQQHED